MDATSFQILSNLKIFSTAILYFFIIGKSLSRTKWFALSLLFIASVFYTIGNYKSKHEIIHIKNAIFKENFTDSATLDRMVGSIDSVKDNNFYITTTGIVLTVIFSLISGFSGVYNEYLFKLDFSDSIYIQNIYIYFYGCILNLIARVFENLKQIFF